MKTIVERAELVVEETVRYEWGGFDSREAAMKGVQDAAAEGRVTGYLFMSADETSTEIAGRRFWLAEERVSSTWSWVSDPLVLHRPATREDWVALS